MLEKQLRRSALKQQRCDAAATAVGKTAVKRSAKNTELQAFSD